jgi:peptidyl-prolyl cis-trans isomerase B (cyclophilin B)
VATTKKRAKELARAKEERRRARQAEEEAKRRRRNKVAVIVVVAAILLGTGGYLLWSGSDSEEPLAGDSGEPPASEDSGAQPVASCEEAGELQDEPKSYEAPGDSGLGGATAATFTLETNCGEIVITADAAAAPETVGAMAFLANDGYFDNTLCHRLTTDGIYVLQCGDPTASGSGGPGFALPDENLPEEAMLNYPAGTVAMANAGPGTSGSQFFLVYRDTTLPSSYTVWGTVTAGLDLVEQVAAAGTTDGGTDGAPLQAVMIQRASAQPQ